MKRIHAEPKPDLFDTIKPSGPGRIPEKIEIPDAEIIFFRDFFTKPQSDVFYEELRQHIPWKQDRIRMYGKEMDVPRLSSWIGDKGSGYAYSGIALKPEPWTPPLLAIKKEIEAVSEIKFNSVLLNLYRDGRDGVAWHSDDEPELGKDPVIGSVSLGETRRFQLKHRYKKELCFEMDLSHGSYLLMKGPTQHFWFHQIPKETRSRRPRINLTFRVIKSVR